MYQTDIDRVVGTNIDYDQYGYDYHHIHNMDISNISMSPTPNTFYSNKYNDYNYF